MEDSDYQAWGNLGDAYFYGGNHAAATASYKKATALAEQKLKTNSSRY